VVDLEEFYADLMNTVHARAEVDNDFTSAAYLNELAECLYEAEEVENLTPVMFTGAGSNNRRLAVSAYDLDDTDESIALAVLAFTDSPVPLTLGETAARRQFKALEHYLAEALSGAFEVGRDEAFPEVQLAKSLRHRGRGVARYRLYLITNQVLSNPAKDFPSGSVAGVPVEYHVWDIERLRVVQESNTGREPLVIDLRHWSPNGVDALKVSDVKGIMTTYLCALPARLLADLYRKHGSRLLEGNVRSYLSARGKVNKAIRSTVLSQPERFIAYNNGITATASGVELSRDGRSITGITDLQIVNGGQTTASLFYVNRDNADATQFAEVSVQAKLVVVTSEKAVEMVPNISRYANSQNKVSEADFFSNSPFHVRLEELSRRILTPARPGTNYQSKWFYERTRGQYQNERTKLSTAEEKKFTATYPRSQVITKTDTAKYSVSWAGRPHLVSSGAQKNFVAFANEASTLWNTSSESVNESYFRALVGKAILFNSVRAAVAKQDWYQSGYLANIVAYTVAKVAHEVGANREGEFDFERLWQQQELSQDTLTYALSTARDVMRVLTSDERPIANVTEWAKREQCWALVRSMPAPMPDAFVAELLHTSLARSSRRAAVAEQRLDDGILAQKVVLDIPPHEWQRISDFARSNRLLTPTDAGIVRVMTNGGLPTERQALRLLEVRRRAMQGGYGYAS
jgi:hypothetical protein